MDKKLGLKCLKKRKSVIAIAAILILAAMAGLYATSPQPGSPNENFVVKVVDTIYDNLNIFRTPEPTNRFISEYDFQLSAADLEYFEEASRQSLAAGYLTEFASDYRKITLTHDGKKYDVQIALFGDNPAHYAFHKKSFKIKTSGEEYLENMRRINFILPLERIYLGPLYAEYVAEKVGLFTPKHEIALVRINGLPQGLYVMEEGWSKYYLERNEQPGLLILERSENWMRDHAAANGANYDFDVGLTDRLTHVTPFDMEISNMQDSGSGFDREIEFKARQLFDAAKANDQGKLEGLLDVDEVARVEAWRAILGLAHDFSGDNMRLYYDTTKGKLGIVPRSEGGIESLAHDSYGIERMLTTYRAGGEEPLPLLRYILRNDKLRNMRNQIIWEQLKEKEGLVSHFGELQQQYEGAFMNDSTSNVRSSKVAYFIGQSKQALEANIELLQKQFGYSKCYINAIKEGNKLVIEVIPDSITAIRFKHFALNLGSNENTEATVRAFDKNGGVIAEGKVFAEGNEMQLQDYLNRNLIQADLGQDMEYKVTVFRYEIVFPEEKEVEIQTVDAAEGIKISSSLAVIQPYELDSISIEMENAITGKALSRQEVYLKIADGSSDYSGLQDLGEQEFLSKYPELRFEKQGSELHLIEGDYNVESDVIIPKNLAIVLDAGAKIRIAPDKAIVSYSSLDIRGSEEKPVEVSRLDPEKPFGALAVIGEGSGKSRATIRHLVLSGGNQKFINGIFFSGQLSIYHSDADIYDSKMSGSSSDDGANIKYGNVRIENSEFSNNYGDQLDLDFCDGVIKNSIFHTKSNYFNGDGLDMSGSNILVKDSSFEDIEDKGISIGEESWIVVYNSLLNDNNSGSAVKDNSKAFFVKDVFGGNNVAIAAYEKKPLFGGAEFFLYGNIFEGNQSETSLDEKSSYKGISFSEQEWQAFSKAVEKEDVFGLKELLKAKE